VEIGHITITPPVLDEDMNVVTEAVLSDKYSVDILWKNDELPSFASYKIWCTPDRNPFIWCVNRCRLRGSIP